MELVSLQPLWRFVALAVARRLELDDPRGPFQCKAFYDSYFPSAVKGQPDSSALYYTSKQWWMSGSSHGWI